MIILLLFIALAALLVISGLLVWLHVRLNKFQKLSADIHEQSSTFTKKLNQAKGAMKALQRDVSLCGPDLQDTLSEGLKLRQELEFMYEKIKSSSQKMDAQMEEIKAKQAELLHFPQHTPAQQNASLAQKDAETAAKKTRTRKSVASAAEHALKSKLGF